MLGSILDQIERIYGLELEVDIQEFLIDRETCQELAGAAAPDSLVVVQQGGEEEIQLGVYIGEDTLSSLTGHDPTKRLTAENFAPFCTVTEEVSHFAYLCWNASQDRSVTRLELELQAEVDKFITSTLLLARQNRGLVPTGLLDRLFGGAQLRDGLDPKARERYLAASALARSYCAWLVRRFLRRAKLQDLLADLRHFYRLSQGGKIGHIYQAVYTS